MNNIQYPLATMDVSFIGTTKWWRAPEYTILDDRWIAPHPDTKWTEFDTYPLMESFDTKSERRFCPHQALLEIDNPEDPEEVLGFVDEFGLLGIHLYLEGDEWATIVSDLYDEYLFEIPVHNEDYRTGDSICFLITARNSNKDNNANKVKILENSKSDPGIAVSNDEYDYETLHETGYMFDGKNIKPRHLKEIYTEPVIAEEPIDMHGEELPTLNGKIREFQQNYDQIKNLSTGSIFEFSREEITLLGFNKNLGIKKTDSGYQGVYKFGSLLDVCYYMLVRDLVEGEIHTCLECGTIWRSENEWDRNAEYPYYCKSKNSKSNCQQIAQNRKSRQRESLKDYLEEQDSTLLKKWPSMDRKDSDNPKHPQDVQQFIKTLGKERKKKILDWVNRTQKHSTKRVRPDPWLKHVEELLEDQIDH